jgi:hypothetical protein
LSKLEQDFDFHGGESLQLSAVCALKMCKR